MNENGRWDLSYLYNGFDDPQLQADMAAYPEQIRAVMNAIAEEGEPRAKIEKIVDAMEASCRTAEKLMLFCELTLAVNADCVEAMQCIGKLDVIMNEAALMQSAFSRYLGTVKDLEQVIASSEKLQAVAFVLREMAGNADHLIDEKIEPWILKMGISGGKAFAQLRDQLDSKHLVEYRGEMLPLSAVRGKAYDSDAQVRRDAYEAEIAAYSKLELPMSYCLNNIKKEARTLAEAKNYPSVLEMTLAESRMDLETLNAMWTAIREYLPDFRRYLKAKAKLLGHKNGLPFYDLFAPVGSAAMSYTAEEARELLKREMGKFTPVMAEFMDNAFEQNWIDLYPRAGKTGGAFCAPAHSFDRSLVMTNFQGSFSDISTLAHELGHAWHNRCLAGLPFMMIDTPMPLAETASIFNETMLSHQVLKHAAPEEEMTLLEMNLMEATQTVVDIYSRFLFEKEVVDTCEDHNMTVDELKDCMLRAQDASYGDGLDPAYRHPYMWACKSHYYSSGLNFYNFPYAFGLLFGKGVFAQWQEKGDAFVEDYCRLLRSCGSDTVANVAGAVGIDVRSVDFWRSSLNVVRADVDRFVALAEATQEK